jgi:hypothetical protein
MKRLARRHQPRWIVLDSASRNNLFHDDSKSEMDESQIKGTKCKIYSATMTKDECLLKNALKFGKQSNKANIGNLVDAILELSDTRPTGWLQTHLSEECRSNITQRELFGLYIRSLLASTIHDDDATRESRMLSAAFDNAWSETSGPTRIDSAFIKDVLEDPKGEETLQDEAIAFLATALETPSVVLKRLKKEMVQEAPKGWIRDRWFLTTSEKPKNKKKLTALQVKVLRILSLLLVGTFGDHNERVEVLIHAWDKADLARTISTGFSTISKSLNAPIRFATKRICLTKSQDEDALHQGRLKGAISTTPARTRGAGDDTIQSPTEFLSPLATAPSSRAGLKWVTSLFRRRKKRQEVEDNSSTSEPDPLGSEWDDSFNATNRILEFQMPHNPTRLLTVESNDSTDADEIFNFGSSLDADDGIPLDTDNGSPLDEDGAITLDTNDKVSPSRYKAPEPPSTPSQGRRFREARNANSKTYATDSDLDEVVIFAEAGDRERLYRLEQDENYPHLKSYWDLSTEQAAIGCQPVSKTVMSIMAKSMPHAKVTKLLVQSGYSQMKQGKVIQRKKDVNEQREKRAREKKIYKAPTLIDEVCHLNCSAPNSDARAAAN